MNKPTILVTGATGNIGRPLIASLLADGARVRALTRDPAAANLPPEADVTGGDYAASGVFAGALRGADAMFVNIGAIRAGLGDLLAARDEGVSRIVLLSSTTVRDQGEQDSALGAQHKMAEDAIKASGIDWTVLRCGGFATNTLSWAATVRTDRVVRAPYGQAAMALVAEQDIAAAAVRTLLDPGHAGQTYYLTGPESLTQIQQAGAIAAAIGQQVRFEELSPETFRKYATQRFPAPVVDDLLRNWAQSVGQTADVAPDLEKIIGRPAAADDPHQPPTLIIDLTHPQPFRHRLSLGDQPPLRKSRLGQTKSATALVSAEKDVPEGRPQAAPVFFGEPEGEHERCYSCYQLDYYDQTRTQAIRMTRG